METTSDPLFVGLTRVPTMAGVPYAAIVFEVGVAGLINIVMGNFLYALVILPIHGVLYAITKKDPGVFAEIAAWVKTNGRCLNRRFWQGASFSPARVQKWLK